MNITEDSSAMTEASGLTGDEGSIGRAGDSIRDVTRETVDELPARRTRLSEMLRKMTVDAPLQSLAIAFLLGVLIARRR